MRWSYFSTLIYHQAIPPLNDKSWFHDAYKIADQLDSKVARHSLLVMTNFGFHFGSHEEIEAPIELAALLPESPHIRIAPPLVEAIVSSARRYGRIPNEV